MSGPITNFDLGMMQHREYETKADRYRRTGATHGGRGNGVAGSKWILTLSVGLSAMLLVALTLL